MGRRKNDTHLAMLEDCFTYMQKHPLREPHKRQDVAERKARNKDTDVTVVKATWKAFCTPGGLALPIHGVLKEVNKAISEAYLLANLHVMRLCDLGLPINPLDQSFFYGCLSAVSVTNRRKSMIKEVLFRESVELYASWRPPEASSPDSQYLSSGWFQNASLQMVTNTKNATSMNFRRRFKRYLKHKYSLDGKDAWAMLTNIMSETYEGDNDLVHHYRSRLPARPSQGRIEDYPHLVSPLQHEFLKYFEEAQDVEDAERDKQLRLFSLLPTKSGFECSHLKMCTNGLHGLLKRAGLDVPGAGPAWRETASEYWYAFFNIQRFETVNRKFAGEILTDGKAVSIVMRKPKAAQGGAPRKPNLTDFDEVWGLDPGRRMVFTACNGEGETQKCSTKQFYEEAFYKRSNATIKGWQERSPEVLEAIRNMPTKKTASLARLKTHMVFLLPRLDMLMDFHMQKGFRKLKLRRYIYANKKLRAICKELTAKAGKRTLVGFGDWSNKDTAGVIKKCPSGPVKRIETMLRRHCKVVAVDEFRTSKLHNVCSHVLQHQQSHMKNKKNGEVRTRRVHSVLFCPNRSCHGMTMDRDENAALNILSMLKHDIRDGSRPAAFCRGVNLEECLSAPEATQEAVRQPVHSGIITN